MKKIFFTLSIVSCISISAQKKYNNIVNSNNITEIENFLKEAHPDDSRRFTLKRKLVSLKNQQWMKQEKSSFSPVQPSKAKAVEQANPTGISVKSTSSGLVNHSSEDEEFRKLISETSATHKEKTVKLLNQLFDNDISNEHAILLIKNTGDCNIIVRIKGKEFYNLAVPAHGENFLTVKKGEYQLSGNMCEARYNSSKNIAKNMLVTLNKAPNTSYAERTGNNANGISN
ncbi:hypothetical protein QGN23_11970 [Chryseobacterium gotjawalense]|uniref:DUF6759 domain-containing protein n=1 Tax=Chryseobacterium gotjawalense TaxID=3042315 RepID=A0ABY8RBD8_9FLAO|nr:DUF6759 domain-containing protein [Chryseobacterium sp. wdc7]WHF51141.1 hypothetical protein QGN23_11970 [Chryseobacterium sp. wdc7]